MSKLKDILNLLWSSQQEMTVSQICDATGYAPMQVHRALQTLKRGTLIKSIPVKERRVRGNNFAKYKVSDAEGRRKRIQRILAKAEEEEYATA